MQYRQHLFTLCCLVGLSASAQDAPGRAGDDEPAIEEASSIEGLVDGLIRDGVDGLRTLWDEVAVSSTTFESLGAAEQLQIDRFICDVDGVAGDETILRITAGDETEWQYLILNALQDGWSAIGLIDLVNQRSGGPSHRIEVAEENRRWLVIEALRGSGPGFEHYHETWHDCTNGVTDVLDYPTSGFVRGHALPFDRTFSGTQVNVSSSGDTRVEVEFTANYSSGEAFAIDGLDGLFSRTDTVRFQRSEEGLFTIDDVTSDLTEAEIIGLFADDEDGFLLHNFAHLKDLATNGNDEHRQWLELFLELCEDSSEKTILTEIIHPDMTTIDSTPGDLQSGSK